MFIGLRSMRIAAAGLSFVMTVYPAAVSAQTAIIPDGRTATTVTTVGNTSTVTTATVSGPNAFNSFSQFRIGAGDIGNLILPSGTSNLINLISGNNPVVINGVLNAYKNGQIGGNVYFASPSGFIVGRSGVLNVGSLNVTTPTREFVDSVVSPSGQINQGAVGNLLAGTVPLSPDGNIRIRGRVNAVDAVRLTGQNVFVGGTREAVNLNHAAQFASTVNSKGLRSANAIVVRNGSIQIVAANSARVNARLAARRGGTVQVTAKNVDIGAKAKITANNKRGNAGAIAIKADQDIKVAGYGTLSAKSANGDAGLITLKAGRNLTVQTGAVFDASSISGNAGLVELSATGAFNIASGIKIKLGSVNGAKGMLLVDPADVIVGTPAQGDVGTVMSNATIVNMIAAVTDGTFRLTATNSITLAADAVIDTRNLDATTQKSTADALNVELNAPTINIRSGAQILAQAVNVTADPANHVAGTSFHDGDVTLTASASQTLLSGEAIANTSITVDGKITGANVAIGASSSATSSFTSSIAGDFALVGSALAGSLLGLNGGYVAASSSATVSIGQHANIAGSKNVDITATASQDAEDPVIAAAALAALSGGSPLVAAVVVGTVSGTVSNTVASGAHISAGGHLKVEATNSATINVSSLASTSSSQFMGVVAYAKANVSTQAIVQTGAVLSSGNFNSDSGVSVAAVNNNNFSATATGITLSNVAAQGGAGAAIAISDISTSATARLGADLGSTSTAGDGSTTYNRNTGNVKVEATTNTSLNSTSSSMTVGTPALIDAIAGAAFNLGGGAGADFLTSRMTPLFATDFDFKVAGSLSLNTTSMSSSASIAASTGSVAPKIYAGGDVTVISNVVDDGIRNNSSAAATSSDPHTGEAYAIAASVAYGTYTHNSNAYVGEGVTINASRIGVAANTVLPNTNTWLQWDSLSATLGHLNTNFGVVGNIVTMYSNATADGGDQLGAAGSVSYLGVTNNTTAWVASAASLTSTTTTAGSWTTPTAWQTQTWTSALSVMAAEQTNSIDIAGNFGALGLLNGTGGGGSSAGGSLNFVDTESNTIAGVSGAVTLTSASDITVNAVTTDYFVGVSPSSGAAEGALALSGIASVAFINNVTHASINDAVTVSAPSVNVTATQNVSLLSIAGAIDLGGHSAVGLAVAYLGATADTSAYIGDNRNDISGGAFSADDSAGLYSGGYFHVDALAVQASTAGRLTAASVAVAESDPTGSPGFASKAKALKATFEGGGAASAATGAAGGAMSGASGASNNFSIDIAGSSSVSNLDMDTSASIQSATIDRFTPTSTTAQTSVRALNNTVLDNGSGSAAVNLLSTSTTSAAVAGAVSIGLSDNQTKAYIDNTTINNDKTVTVEALNGGQQTIIGIGLAVSTGSNGGAGSASASVGIISDSANGYISNSSITGVTGTSGRTVDVNAYENAKIGIGGGSLYVSGGKAGVGVALTYAEITDPDGGKAVDAHIYATSISQFDAVTVSADDASKISAGAATGGAGSNGFAGAIVVDIIDSTTIAYIDSNSTKSINVTSGVTVTADSTAVATLAQLLDALVRSTNGGNAAQDVSGIDYTAAAYQADSTADAAIFAGAGLIQAGKNNLGFSLVYNTIQQTHSAYIGNVLVTVTNGDVAVAAGDSSQIFGLTIGFGLATGQFAGVGGFTVNTIGNTVTARIGGATATNTNSTVSANDVIVVANDHASIKGSAAVAGASTQGSAAGLALVYNGIANTVGAEIVGSKIVSAGDVTVSAASTGTILSVAVGVALSSSVGLAGSVATSVLGTDVTADITGGADVKANNNVAVLASNTDTASVFGGAVAISTGAGGGGGSVVTSEITGSTSAYISGAATKVDALGMDSADTLSVNSGTMVSAFNLGTAGAPSLVTPNLNEAQDTIKGLAVVASSHQAVNTVVTSVVSSSGIAVMINPITNVMGGTTSAYIDSAAIDTRLIDTTPAPQVDVAASSISYSNAFGFGAAVPQGGGAAGGATIISTTMNRKTESYIKNATVGGGDANHTPYLGAVTVKANAIQSGQSIAVGYDSGSIALNVFNATTEAWVDGGSVTAASLAVKATDDSGIISANGSGAYSSGGAAVGASFVVQVSLNTTEAYVGDEFHYYGGTAPNSTALYLTGALDIVATTNDTFKAYSIGGAVASGGAAIAGTANIEIASNTTIAGLYDATVQSPSGDKAGNVTIHANENVSIDEIAGSLSLSTSVGFGAAANVLVFRSQTTAESRNSDIKSSGTVDVAAQSDKSVTSYAIAGAGGISVGIGAAVGVIIIGTNTADADTQGQETGQLDQGGNGTLTNVNNGTNNSQGSQGVTGTTPHTQTSNANSTYNVGSVLTGGNSGVTAQIAGGHVTANEVDVAATGGASAKMFLLGAGIGGNVGVGAAIGYTSVDSSVLANLNAIVVASAVSVTSTVQDGSAGKTIDVISTAGGGALYFGASAAVAVSSVSNVVTAELGGQVSGPAGGNAPAVLVSAADTSSQSTLTGGGSGGAVAIGASVATADKSSSVTAKILDSTSVTAAAVVVMASDSGAVSASATSVAGGIAAGVGAAATADEDSSVTAFIGASASVTTGAQGVLVNATGAPELSSYSIGVAVGGVGMGASVAMSDAKLHIESYVGDSSTFSGGSLTITGSARVPASGNVAYASAIAGGGGSLIGLQGSYAQGSNETTVSAYGGTNVTLPSANVIIAAENDTNQYATATGIAFGYIGVGATVSQVSSSGNTSAYLGSGAITASSNTGSLSITATGNDVNVANATAGSGGVIAGAAAVATTSTTSTVNATLYGGSATDTLYLAGLGVQAVHTTTYAANGDAFQASYVGASGGNATNTVNSSVTAEVGTNLIINSAANDMNVIAMDVVTQTGGGARAGSGGVAAGAATVSSSTVTQTVATKIDAGTIFSLNDDPSTSVAKINIEAYALLNTLDTVSLTAGGLFAGGGASSEMNATANVSVNINAAELFSAGSIDIGSAVQIQASNNARADLYGLVTGAGATTRTNLTANQTVYIGATTIEGWNTVNIYAGLAGDGSRGSFVTADATTVVYNQALIPISAAYSGTANAYNYSTLTLDTGSKVLGVSNVFIGSSQGTVTANGKGTNYNPYLTLFSTENHDDNADSSSTGDLVLNGLVVAGIHNQQIITIALNGSPVLSSGDPDSNNYAYGLTLEQVSDQAHFNPVFSYTHQTIQYAVVGGFNPRQQVIDQLVALSGMSQADVITQLNNQNPVITVPTASDPTGDIQRQINTLIQQAPFTANAAGQAFVFNDILVSEGNVSLLAKTISGASAGAIRQGTDSHGAIMCSVCARGSALIDIENQGLNFTAFNKLTVTGITGGHINFTGNATAATSTGVSYQQVNAGTTPSIIVNASYNRTDPTTGHGVDPSGHALVTTPDVYFGGVVTNLNGLVSVTNQLGNVVTTQSIDAATFQLLVPNGSFTVNGGAGSIFNTNNDVASQWANVEYKPMDTLTAVEAAATYLGTYGSATLGVENSGNTGYHPYDYYYSNSGTTYVNAPVGSSGYSDPSAVFTARLLSLAYGSGTLRSAVFLPMGGCPTNGCGLGNASAANEGTSASNIRLSGWERGWYEDQAYGDGGHGGPIHCSGCGTYFQIINIQQQAITPVTANVAVSPPPTTPLIVGKAIIISASVVNINGTIQSGQSSNFSVDIGAAAKTIIDGINNDSTALANAKSAAAAGHYVDLSSYITANSGDTKIDAQYNAQTNQIMLNSVVQGTGGYVYLNGKIISTSTDGTSQGNIVVNGGAGTVNVNNTTGYALVTNTINTGVSAASVVEIVDQLKQQTTWYVYNAGAQAGQQVATYRQSGVNASGYQNATLTGTSGTANVQYAPLANQFYQWVDTATITRSPTSTVGDYGWVFSGPGTALGNATNPYVRSTSLVSNLQQTANYQETVTAAGSYHLNSFQTNATNDKCCGTDFNGTWNQDIYYSLTLTLTNSVKASNPINIHFNGGGTSSVNVNSNASIVVNGPINNLQGVTSLTTTGASSTITAGPSINNPIVSGTSVNLSAQGGIGMMGTPLPVQAYGGTLRADSTDSDIAIAAIGSLSIDHVKVGTTHFNATTGVAEPQGSVFISATGDITSAAPYNLNNPIVVGKNVEIDTTGGAIGAVSTTVGGVTALANINPLVIQASVTVLDNGELDGGVLNSTSSNGAYMVQSSGDVRLGAIKSNGPIFLESVNGNILNGQISGGLTAEQSAYLANVWSDLNMVNGTGAQEVTNYQSMIDAAYNDYWQLRNLAFQNGSTYAITTLGTTAIGAQLIAQHTLAQGTDLNSADAQAAIRTEAINRFLKDQYLLGIKTAAELGVPLTTLFGATAGQASTFQAAVSTAALTAALTNFSSSFRYQLPTSSALYTSLNSGSQWTLDQLRYTVSASANPANGVPPPSIAHLPLNISGRQVMLYAPNGSIGSLAQPATFSFTSVDASSLSDTNKALLASAGPGQLTVTAVTDPVTHVISYTVEVAQQSLVIVDPLGPVSAKAKDQIYLGSATDILLGGIPADVFGPIVAAQTAGIQTTATGGIIRLDAVRSILGGVSGQVAISGNIAELTLIAETGSIGQAPAAGTDPGANPEALLLALTGGAAVGRLDQVSAAQGIYLRQTAGDLVLGNITSGNGSSPIQFAASGSIYAEPQFTDRSFVHIAGSALDLRAGGNVSFNAGAFQPLQVKISSAVTGVAGGDMTILSPSSSLTVGTTAAYGALSSGGTLTLNTAAGDLNINGSITSVDDMQLLANGAVNFAAGTALAPVVAASTAGAVTLVSATLSMGAYAAIDAAGIITVTTTGDATLGQLKSTASYIAAGNAASIVVAAGGVTAGSLSGNGDGQINFLAAGTDARVSLSATAIGTGTRLMGLTASQVAATAAGGGIYLHATSDIEATTLSAAKGSVDMLADANLKVDSAAAGTAGVALGTFTADAGGTLDIGTATSTGSQVVHGAQNVAFTTLTATGYTGDAGNISVTSDHGAIQGTTVAANGFASLAAATTNKGTTLTATNGLANLTGAGLIDWTTLTAGTTLNIRSTGDAIHLATATSGGTQTIRAAANVTVSQLTATGITGDAGDIGVTSDNGAIQATTVSANGSATLSAATTNKGTTLTATTGLASLTGASLIEWTTLTAGTTLNIRSTGDSISFASATSGGSQTIHANDNVTFKQASTSGIVGDAGDITMNADTGAITAQTVLIAGVATQGSVAANGSARLTAATINTGNTLTATTGDAVLNAGGLIAWNNITAGKAVTAISTGGAIAVTNVTSGGSQTLHAFDDITFTALTATGIPGDVGNITLISDTGSVTGSTIAANGDVGVEGGNSIGFSSLQGASVSLSTPNDISVGQINVFRALTLASDTMTVNATQLPSNPPVPLHVIMTGYHGGVATLANVNIDPPVVVVDLLQAVDVNLAVDSPSLTITSGYVPGQLMLTTPAGDILLNNRSPAPVGGVNLQLYQPNGQFSMSQFGNANFSNTQVVWYDTTISSTITNYGGGDFSGTSFVRNSLLDMRNGDGFDPADGKSGLVALHLFAIQPQGGALPLFIEVIGNGPAVNIEGLDNATEIDGKGKIGAKATGGKFKSTMLQPADGMTGDSAGSTR